MKTTIDYKSVLIGLTIKAKNIAFNNLSPEIQRLEIAWDALNLVLSETLKPSNGCYWNYNLREIGGDDKNLQKTLNAKSFYRENDCYVCQRGLMMVSQIRLGNSISSGDDTRESGSADNIKGFSIYSFIKMETEYEKCAYGHPYDSNTKEKMANICCNILVNGDFNTKDETDYLVK